MPDPSLLDKRTWYNSVLPQMRFRMGYPDQKMLSLVPPADRKLVVENLPDNPLISEKDWDLVFDYYVRSAPDSLAKPDLNATQNIPGFEPIAIKELPARITHLRFDRKKKVLLAGTATGHLFELNRALHKKDSTIFASAISCILPSDSIRYVLLMGIMFPNDQAVGTVAQQSVGNSFEVLIDSLQRPVFFDEADFNADGLSDLAVCSFGNYTGSLDVFERTYSSFRKHVVRQLPGARNVVIQDFNQDGLPDILALMTQGDESILLYTNRGGFKFTEAALLRFPPVFGSSYFEVHDFNKDGHFDILYSNGDNGDYSVISKPYHGVRIFLNDGSNNFTERYFAAMPGASQVMAFDFDGDNDLDLAAISFFPDTWENGFVYFRNEGNFRFSKFATPLARQGRWVTMDLGDVDGDNDVDILLGSLSSKGLGAGEEISAEWRRGRTSILVLENQHFPH